MRREDKESRPIAILPVAEKTVGFFVADAVAKEDVECPSCGAITETTTYGLNEFGSFGHHAQCSKCGKFLVKTGDGYVEMR